jgi:hypothetical protein
MVELSANITSFTPPAAGSTTNFDLYQVVENYFKDLEKRRKINHVLGIKEDRYELAEDFGIK